MVFWVSCPGARWCVNGVTDYGGEPSEMDGEPLQLKAYKNELPLDDPRYLYIEKGDVVEIVLENGWALNRVNEQRKSCLMPSPTGHALIRC